MRRLLLACLLAAVPVLPASASPGECVVANGFPVCAGTCSTGEVISVSIVGLDAIGSASCGGATAQCFVIRGTCTATARATSSGALTCKLTAGTGVAQCEVKIAST